MYKNRAEHITRIALLGSELISGKPLGHRSGEIYGNGSLKSIRDTF